MKIISKPRLLTALLALLLTLPLPAALAETSTYIVKSGETRNLTWNLTSEQSYVVEAGGTLIIPSGTSITNSGSILSKGGAIVVEGTLTNYNLLQIANSGSLTVSGTLSNSYNSSYYGELQVYNGTLSVSGTLSNSNSIEVLEGGVDVSGSFYNYATATLNTKFTLTGTLTNSSELNTDAGFALASTGYFSNTGYAYFCGGTQTFTSGTFRNTGYIFVMNSAETLSHDTLTVADSCSKIIYTKSIIKNYDPHSKINGIQDSYIDESTSVDLAAAWDDASACLEAVKRGSAIPAETVNRISAVTASDLSAYTLSQSGSLPEGIEYCGMTLELNSAGETVTVRLVFRLSDGAEDVSFTLDGYAVTPEEQTIYTVVVLPACSASYLSAAHTLVLSNGGTRCTLRFSPLSYAAAAYAEGGNLLRMAQALYCLQEAAA